ncbi:MAG TPA: hypothetical protein VML50_05025 [Anaeromyxobacter sp.]|nr:hypothetical protein [Anaeromyxobacter sp.]
MNAKTLVPTIAIALVGLALEGAFLAQLVAAPLASAIQAGERPAAAATAPAPARPSFVERIEVTGHRHS